MSEITQIRKFMFDRHFTGNADHDALPVKKEIKPIYTAEQFEAAKQDAYNDGFNAGRVAAGEDQQAQLNSLVQRLERQLGLVRNELAARQAGAEADIAEVSLAIAQKIMPSYIAQEGLQEVISLITTIIKDMAREPRLVIRVGDANFDVVKEQVKTISEQQAYPGEVVVLAEPNLGKSDCKIEWADGGIERDTQNMWNEIDKALAKAKGTSAPSSGVDAASSIAPLSAPPPSTTDVAV